METMTKDNVEGECPECGADIKEHYGAYEIDGSVVTYDFTCPKCGTEGQEVCSVTYSYTAY